MNKKMIAPIVIGIMIALYIMIWLFVLFFIDAPNSVLILMGLMTIVFLILWIFIVMERIQEIRSGEENDLSKY